MLCLRIKRMNLSPFSHDQQRYHISAARFKQQPFPFDPLCFVADRPLTFSCTPVTSLKRWAAGQAAGLHNPLSAHRARQPPPPPQPPPRSGAVRSTTRPLPQAGEPPTAPAPTGPNGTNGRRARPSHLPRPVPSHVPPPAVPRCCSRPAAEGARLRRAASACEAARHRYMAAAERGASSGRCGSTGTGTAPRRTAPAPPRRRAGQRARPLSPQPNAKGAGDGQREASRPWLPLADGRCG